jgi:hypothetical protein
MSEFLALCPHRTEAVLEAGGVWQCHSVPSKLQKGACWIPVLPGVLPSSLLLPLLALPLSLRVSELPLSLVSFPVSRLSGAAKKKKKKYLDNQLIKKKDLF